MPPPPRVLLDPLQNSIQTRYCPERQCHYWSPDGKVWMRENVLLVQEGEFLGKKPLAQDLVRLQGEVLTCTVQKASGLCQICK